MRKIFLAAAIIVSFAACGGGRDAEIAFVETDEYEAEEYEAEEILPPVEIPPIQEILGQWYWHGVPYYEFRPDGTGQRNNGEAMQDLHWQISDGILSVCDTPEYCAGNCPAPAQWFFEVEDDHLTLTHTVYPGEIFFSYTRR